MFSTVFLPRGLKADLEQYYYPIHAIDSLGRMSLVACVY